MKKNLFLICFTALLFSCSEKEPDIQPAPDEDFVVVEGDWNLDYRQYTLYDSLHNKLTETKHTFGPGNWLSFISGGVFREFENGRMLYAGTFTNENNILTLKFQNKIQENEIDTLTLTRLVYHEKYIYPNKDYHIYRTAAKK